MVQLDHDHLFVYNKIGNAGQGLQATIVEQEVTLTS